jgi:hypothetical protein
MTTALDLELARLVWLWCAFLFLDLAPSAHNQLRNMPLIQHWIEKCLLEAIEETAKPRNEVSLIDICERFPGVFGTKGDAKRRNIQFHFNNLKRKRIRSWADYLDRFQVPHGEATIRLLRELGQQPSPPSPVGLLEAQSPPSDGADILNSAFGNLSIREELPPQPVQSPPLRRRFSFSTPTEMETPDIPTPGWTDPPSSAMVTRDPSSNPPSDPSSFLGSKTNPHIIQVDPEFPEKHREFDIEFVERMKHGDYFRSGYHIRTEVGVKDPDLWSATMCQEAGYENRAVLVKGPARSCWFRNVDQYHRRDFCTKTKEAHSSTESMLAFDKKICREQYWLLVFKEDVLLDNVIFSGDPFYVEKKSIGLKEEIQGVECRSSMVYWIIAKKHGGFRRLEERKDTFTGMFS